MTRCFWPSRTNPCSQRSTICFVDVLLLLLFCLHVLLSQQAVQWILSKLQQTSGKVTDCKANFWVDYEDMPSDLGENLQFPWRGAEACAIGCDVRQQAQKSQNQLTRQSTADTSGHSLGKMRGFDASSAWNSTALEFNRV